MTKSHWMCLCHKTCDSRNIYYVVMVTITCKSRYVKTGMLPPTKLSQKHVSIGPFQKENLRFFQLLIKHLSECSQLKGAHKVT